MCADTNASMQSIQHLKGSHFNHMLPESHFQIPWKAWVKCVQFRFWLFQRGVWRLPAKVERNDACAAQLPVPNSHANYGLSPISSNLFVLFAVARCPPSLDSSFRVICSDFSSRHTTVISFLINTIQWVVGNNERHLHSIITPRSTHKRWAMNKWEPPV